MTTQTKPQGQDVPLAKPGQPSDNTPKMISESDHIQAISNERAKLGRLEKQLEAVTKERDSFKAEIVSVKKELNNATSEWETTKTRVEELESDLETLNEENAPAAEIAKIRKRLTAAEAQLKRDYQAKSDAADELRKTLEKEREEWADTVSIAQATNFEIAVWDIASEFESGDPEKLKNACDRAGIKTEEGARGLAEVLWTRRGKAAASETLMESDSGAVTGGGKGRRPTLTEVQAASPSEVATKFASGEWTR